MIRARRLGIAAVALLALLSAVPAWGSTPTYTGRRSLLPRLLFVHQGEHAVVLSLSSVEWGTANRWSFTSRGVCMFGSECARNRARWFNTVALTASPGLGSRRVGLGCQFIPSAKPWSDLSLICKARGVLLRPWPSPMVVGPDCTFTGVELRGSPVGFLNAGAGWYGRIQGAEGGRDDFWGFHVGVGM
jgi:hypothetical protein